VRKMNKRGKIVIGLLIVLLLVVGFVIFNKFFKFDTTEKENADVIKSIDSYDYVLKENNTEYFKKLYYDLEKLLQNVEYDRQEYAVFVAKLFAVDFYSLDSKEANSDIGGVQFIHSDAVDNFVLKAQDTVYKYVENNFDGNRKQKLPNVDNIVLDSVEKISYTYNEIVANEAYKVKLKLEYEVDYQYPKQMTITLINEDNKLSIVEIE